MLINISIVQLYVNRSNYNGYLFVMDWLNFTTNRSMNSFLATFPITIA